MRRMREMSIPMSLSNVRLGIQDFYETANDMNNPMTLGSKLADVITETLLDNLELSGTDKNKFFSNFLMSLEDGIESGE